MPKSLLICPDCGAALERDPHTLRCANGHCFDIAKEGYVNLLPANRRHSSTPGDDREMVNARTAFLNGGWYAPLKDRLCETVAAWNAEEPVLLDAGCGEGYYTEALCGAVAEKGGRVCGVDLSKAAARRAAKRCPQAEIAVASVYRLPLADRSADILFNCFSPLADGEFRRVLKPGGLFLYVVPGPRHLWELKEILYENPYENELREESYFGFRAMPEIPLQFRFLLQRREEIAALFHMTPYTWKTPKAGAERLAELQELEVTAEFRILRFQRSGEDQGRH
ncbi:MAG: methyltransferase domain-containing protein [Oscillospiraceae bacterium]|nr:methyltransferase domain-containing protein [Oscillospiraceae bacterium]